MKQLDEAKVAAVPPTELDGPDRPETTSRGRGVRGLSGAMAFMLSIVCFIVLAIVHCKHTLNPPLIVLYGGFLTDRLWLQARMLSRLSSEAYAPQEHKQCFVHAHEVFSDKYV